MRKLLPVISLSFLSLVCVQGQQKETLPKHFNYRTTITRQYDRFEDKTIIRLEPMVLYGSYSSGLTLSIVEDFPGKTTKDISAAGFVLIIASQNHVTVPDTTLRAMIDGERVNLGTLVSSGEQRSEGLILSGYMTRLSLEMLSKMANAKKVEMRFNGLEFELDEYHRYAIRDFLHYIQGGNLE